MQAGIREQRCGEQSDENYQLFKKPDDSGVLPGTDGRAQRLYDAQAHPCAGTG